LSSNDNAYTEEQRERMLDLVRNAGDHLRGGPEAFGYIHQADPQETEGTLDNMEVASRKRDDLYYLLSRFVSKIDGVMAIKEFCKNNKGKTYLDLVTYSDIAYFAAVLKNLEETWDYEYRRDIAVGEELGKFNDPQKIQDEDERKNYTEPKPRFTGAVKKKRELFRMMWNREGETYYRAVYDVWEKAMADECVVAWIEEGWDEWVGQHGVGGHWRRNKARNKKSTGKDPPNSKDMEEGAMQAPDIVAIMTNKYKKKKSEDSGGGEMGERRVDSEESDEDSDEDGKSESDRDDESDDDESEGEQEGPKQKRRKKDRQGSESDEDARESDAKRKKSATKKKRSARSENRQNGKGKKRKDGSGETGGHGTAEKINTRSNGKRKVSGQ